MCFSFQPGDHIDPLCGLKGWLRPQQDEMTFDHKQFLAFLPPTEASALEEAVGKAYYVLQFVSYTARHSAGRSVMYITYTPNVCERSLLSGCVAYPFRPQGNPYYNK